MQPRGDNTGYIRNTQGLALQFEFTQELTKGRKMTKGKVSGGMKTVLAMLQKQWLAANYIPSITTSGQTVPIDVHRGKDGTWEATTEANGHVLRLNHLNLCGSAVGRLHADELQAERFVGLILDVAQATRSVGDIQVLDDTLKDRFTMMILVLWQGEEDNKNEQREQGRKWERCGLIEHSTPAYGTSETALGLGRLEPRSFLSTIRR